MEETLQAKFAFDNIEVWTVKTNKRQTRIGTAHTFMTEAGGFITLFELRDLYKFNKPLPRLKTVDGFEEVTSIEDGNRETVIMLSLSGPSHVYILDGFYNHNVVWKG